MSVIITKAAVHSRESLPQGRWGWGEVEIIPIKLTEALTLLVDFTWTVSNVNHFHLLLRWFSSSLLRSAPLVLRIMGTNFSLKARHINFCLEIRLNSLACEELVPAKHHITLEERRASSGKCMGLKWKNLLYFSGKASHRSFFSVESLTRKQWLAPNQMQNLSQSQIGHSRFPALLIVCLFPL